MKMRKTTRFDWGRYSIVYMVVGEFLGQKAATYAEFDQECPREIIAAGLLEERRECRVIIERAKRGHAKAHARSLP